MNMIEAVIRMILIYRMKCYLCKYQTTSIFCREFITKHYAGLKLENPGIPVLVRECSGIKPRVWARFAYGEERSADLSGQSADQVLATVKDLTLAEEMTAA